jgi:hypothetical protein
MSLYFALQIIFRRPLTTVYAWLEQSAVLQTCRHAGVYPHLFRNNHHFTQSQYKRKDRQG